MDTNEHPQPLQHSHFEPVENTLSALTAQLQPHFIFNTINMIRFLVREQPEQAEKAIINLSKLLRFSTKQAINPIVPFSKELEHINALLEIAALRFEDRFTVRLQTKGLPPDFSPPP